MTYAKVVAAVLGCALLIIQFVRPEKNRSPLARQAGIESVFPVPPDVIRVFERSCYDCHSDNTAYPWYAEVQPVGWWLNSHIEHGKRQLDFDRFGSYRPWRQFGKLKEIGEQLRQDDMPLGSYLLIHRYARLTEDEKAEVMRWSSAMMDSMKTHFPPDSLERKRKREK